MAGTHTIHPSETEKLLGCHIHQSLKWREHIQTDESSLIRQLTSRLNALRKLAVNAPFKTRLMAANSVFISVLSYLIPLWGACEGYLIKALQVIQNKAARCVTKVSWFTATRQLLLQCGWMSIRQLISITQCSPCTRSSRVAAGSFIIRGTEAYNSIPDNIKSTLSLPTVKKKLKTWILANIPIE